MTPGGPEGPEGPVGPACTYRDLIPGRLDGMVIASHITIPGGGDVPDYVHYHDVSFQLIFCHRGWVDVVYEGQGPPFRLEPGDAILQAPGIRHRVLRASPGLEVIELGSPAEHETHVDPAMTLPSPDSPPDRRFEGQRFVRHQRASVAWQTGAAGLCVQETDIADATGGAADVRLLRVDSAPTDGIELAALTASFRFWFVRQGTANVALGGDLLPLSPHSALVIPSCEPFRLTDPTPDLELLEVSLTGGSRPDVGH